MTESPTPVVFVHGLWLHHTSWGPWQDLFSENGYAPVAPPWPGEQPTVAATRADPHPMGGYGVGEVANHYAEVVTALPRKPIVIGHSFGGIVAQILLGRGLADAAVAIDPAPIKGVLPLPVSSLRVASIALRNPANIKGTVALSPEQFTYGFANNRTPEECAALYDAWAMPSPGKPLFQAASANLTPARGYDGGPGQLPPRPAADHRGWQGPHRAGVDLPLHVQAAPRSPRRSPTCTSSPRPTTPW